MLWIVGYWHSMGYWNSPYDSIEGSNFEQVLTWGMLSGFTFFSGYFLRKKSVNSYTEFFIFYKARFWKFYILFALSCISLLIAGLVLTKIDKGQVWFNSTADFMFSIIGLGTYFGTAPATLWFMTMLMSFYFITPFLLYQKGINRYLLIITLNIIIIVCTLQGKIDSRNMMYFPFYCLGILTGSIETFIENNSLKKMILSLTIFALSAIMEVKSGMSIGFWFYISSFTFIITLLIGSRIIETKYKLIVPIMLKVSFSSMAAFLFHRQIYGVLKLILGSVLIDPIITTLVFAPTAFISAYYIQIIYDKLTKSLHR
jgi:hypothetical protein